MDKARRCYQKALQLHPKSLEVAELLSDVLLLLHDVVSISTFCPPSSFEAVYIWFTDISVDISTIKDGNIKLLDMMSQASNARWIWLRLGLLHTERNEIDKAITYLCNAVRSDPSDW